MSHLVAFRKLILIQSTWITTLLDAGCRNNVHRCRNNILRSIFWYFWIGKWKPGSRCLPLSHHNTKNKHFKLTISLNWRENVTHTFCDFAPKDWNCNLPKMLQFCTVKNARFVTLNESRLITSILYDIRSLFKNIFNAASHTVY